MTGEWLLQGCRLGHGWSHNQRLSNSKGKPVNAIKRARRYIERNPSERSAVVLSQLVFHGE